MTSYRTPTRRLINAARNHSGGELSGAEKAERERRRLFSTGVTTYRWMPDSRHLCCVIDGAIHLFDCADSTLRAITEEGLRQTDLTVSGLGRYLSYVRDGDLYLFDLELGHEERLTHDASDCVTNGVAEFIAQEEMHRFEGHWWSPDDRHLVFTRVDNSMIPVSYRYEFTASELVAVAATLSLCGRGQRARRTRRRGSEDARRFGGSTIETPPMTISRASMSQLMSASFNHKAGINEHCVSRLIRSIRGRPRCC